MQLDANDVINRLSLELANATQRAILAEARADAAEKALEENKEDNGS